MPGAAIEKALRPNDKQHADAAPALIDLPERGKIDSSEHRQDHQPDEDRSRQLTLAISIMPNGMKSTQHNMSKRHGMAKRDIGDDAQRNPKVR